MLSTANYQWIQKPRLLGANLPFGTKTYLCINSIEFKDYFVSEFFCLGFKDYYFIVCYSHKFACLLCPENLKLIAEYFQRSETFGGPLRDWIGIYEECKT